VAHPAQELLEAYLDLEAIDRRMNRADYWRVPLGVAGMLAQVAVFALVGMPWGLANVAAAMLLALGARSLLMHRAERQRDMAQIEPAAFAAFVYLTPTTEPLKVGVRVEER
jgi:hypothetical protein